MIAAKHARRPLDHVSLVGSLVGISMPVFFLALILKWAFAVKLGWLPSIGRLDVRTDLHRRTNLFLVDSVISGNGTALWDAIRHLILPAIALGTIPLAIITRITRSAVLDVMQEDHVRTARAKGLAPRLIDRRHVLRNALLPVVTVIGLQTGLLLSGAILTETVFAWGGLGTWVYDAVARARLRRAAGRHPLRRPRVRDRQPARRPRLLRHRSQDPRRMATEWKR